SLAGTLAPLFAPLAWLRRRPALRAGSPPPQTSRSGSPCSRRADRQRSPPPDRLHSHSRRAAGRSAEHGQGDRDQAIGREALTTASVHGLPPTSARGILRSHPSMGTYGIH